MEKAIEVKNLYVSYDKTKVIEDLSLTIPKGKITIIIGPNGCGKSTLLKTIGRIKKADSGTVLIEDKPITKYDTKELAKRMAILPQSPIVPQGLLVKELVSSGRFPYQKPLGSLTKKDLDIIHWAMEKTGVLEYADQAVDALSGGQRQRVFIAMALAQETEIVLLDEPTTFLDIAYQIDILKLLVDINKASKRTVVVVLHDLNHAFRFADTIIGMKKGKILFQGRPKEVITEKSLKDIYGVTSELILDKTGSYPICIEYDL